MKFKLIPMTFQSVGGGRVSQLLQFENSVVSFLSTPGLCLHRLDYITGPNGETEALTLFYTEIPVDVPMSSLALSQKILGTLYNANINSAWGVCKIGEEELNKYKFGTKGAREIKDRLAAAGFELGRDYAYEALMAGKSFN